MEQVAKLRALAQVDVDAIAAYDVAISRVSEPLVRERLEQFRRDHVRHVRELDALVQRLGAGPLALRPDLRGAAMRGLTALGGMMGTEATLLAMLGNEEVSNRAYALALALEWDVETRLLIRRHRADEERHGTWVRDALRERPWQPGGLGSLEREAHA